MDTAQENVAGGSSQESNLDHTVNTPIAPQNENETGSPASSSLSNPFFKEWRSLLVYLSVTLAIALFVRFYIATPYIVQGASMEPSFDNYHYLIIDRITYHFSAPKRGDVVVFTMPQDRGRALIKRVIGLPGETVRFEGSNPTITIVSGEHPGGVTLDEPYIDPVHYGGSSDMEIKLGADQYLVLGDNRRVSADSRLWGYLPAENIVGKVMVRLYPFQHIGLTPGEFRFDDQF